MCRSADLGGEVWTHTPEIWAFGLLSEHRDAVFTAEMYAKSVWRDPVSGKYYVCIHEGMTKSTALKVTLGGLRFASNRCPSSPLLSQSATLQADKAAL